MKKILILFFLVLIVPKMDAQNKVSIYGGLNLTGVSVNEFENFHISDWENYGLLSLDPNSAEGRVAVNLANKKPSSLTVGAVLGLFYSLAPKLDALVEVQITFSRVEYKAAFVGIKYDLVSTEKFTLGITPKIGFTLATANFGEISLIPGYTPPVILREGTFTNGDTLKMDISGLAASLNLTPMLKFSDKFGLYANLGYQISFAGDPALKASSASGTDVDIPMTAKGVVKSDLSATQAGIKPSILPTGLSIHLGISYKF